MTQSKLSYSKIIFFMYIKASYKNQDTNISDGFLFVLVNIGIQFVRSSGSRRNW